MHNCTFFTTWSSWLKEIISAGSVGEQSSLLTHLDKILFILLSKSEVSPALPLLGGAVAGETCSA